MSKVDAEIPSPVAGVLSEIKFIEGATVEVNMVVAVIAGAPQLVEAPTDLPTQRVPGPCVSCACRRADRRAEVTKVPRLGCSSIGAPARPEKSAPTLHSVPATGLGGRITKEDLLGHLSRQGKQLCHDGHISFFARCFCLFRGDAWMLP